jgi:phenylalanine-4-hydroxylase
MATPAPTVRPLPPHLARFVVEQDYGAYSARDQAVWRHILRALAGQLRDRAHPSYLEGLAAAGIGLERIPSLEEMNRRLAGFGWSAVAVRGFIPPAVFTELQALGVLAIAADIRSHEHIGYTPAPDIVHESAGHAPILADPEYSRYLRRCGEAGFRAIASLEDGAVFAAIRHLSVVKEDPASSPADLAAAAEDLRTACASRSYVSESTRASRLYWWTAEYGLVGPLERPRIYGAGLLSSLGEAVHCLGPGVRRLPLSLECVEQDFDITSMQPQLYVARDFGQLFEVLEQFEATLAWRRGGLAGLEEARRAGTVNHLLLSGGRELTGRVVQVWAGPDGTLAGAQALLEGPVLLSRGGIKAAEPWPGPALVTFAGAPPPEREPLTDAYRVASDGLPGVAGGPGDPEAWDRHFGPAAAASGEQEALARRRKAEALPAALADRYAEVRWMREHGPLDRARLAELRRELPAWPGDWLLAAEIEELLGGAAPLDEGTPHGSTP